MAAISLQSVTKRFGDVTALDDVTETIADGSLTVVLGPSGCGKSTMLRVIAGLDAADSGRMTIGGDDVTALAPARRGVAMVFQSYALYPHMTVFENMAFGLRRAGRERAAVRAAVVETARLLRIDHLLDRKPRALSGGQRQRVAMGRALVRTPRAFLFDEPLSNLDAALRVEMRVEIAALQKRFGATMVYVTHDQVEAMTLADRILLMRDGRVVQGGAPMEIYRRPRDRFVAAFLGAPGMNLIEARVVGTAEASLRLRPGQGAEVTLPHPPGMLRVGDAVTLGVRPEDLGLGAARGPALTGELVVAERLGAETHLHVAIGSGTRIVARTPGESPLARGGSLTLSADPEDWHLFAADGVRIGEPRST